MSLPKASHIPLHKPPTNMNTHLDPIPPMPSEAPADPLGPLEMLLDLETLDTTPGAIITELAAATFRRHGESFTILDELDLPLDPWEQLKTGRAFSPATIAFHQRHGTLPTATATESPADAFQALRHFAEGVETVWIWGLDFDSPILADLARQLDHPLPWSYWQTRDARTVWKLAFGDKRHATRPHKALEDVRASIADLHAARLELNR